MENITHVQDDEVLVLEVSSESEARRQAASHWGISGDEVVLNVILEEKSFFGLFGKKLKIEARRPAPQQSEPQSETEASADEEESNDFLVLLKRVLCAANLDLEATVLSDGSVNLTGPDSRILLAGRRGEGLKALDYVVNLMARNEGPVPHVRLDCDGFRRKREKELERIAMEAAKEAMKTRRTVYLQPMSSWERRIVHLTLKESSNVETHSIGVEPGRKVAVRLVGASSSRSESYSGCGDGKASYKGSSRDARGEKKSETRTEKSGSGRGGSSRPRRRSRSRSQSKPQTNAEKE